MFKNKFLIFYISAFLIFFTYFSQITVFAQNFDSAQKEEQKVNYDLPYPGILPDNPIYFLKAARDRVIGFLISDPLKKAQFNLLTSDKKTNAAVYLSDRKKYDLSLTSFSKGTNYFEEGIKSIEGAKTLGKDVQGILENMKPSIKKHKEVLIDMEKSFPKSFKSQLESEAKRLEDIEKSVNRLSLKN